MDEGGGEVMLLVMHPPAADEPAAGAVRPCLSSSKDVNVYGPAAVGGMANSNSISININSGGGSRGWDPADGWSVFAAGSGLPHYVQLRVYQLQGNREVAGLKEFVQQGEWGS